MASSSLTAPDAPAGFKWVLICDKCKYCYCFECLQYCIKSSPLCKNILEKWIQANNHCIPNHSYFVQSHKLSRGTITGGPMQGQRYIYLYTPCITFEDYCAIMIQARFVGSCWILFDCETFKENQIWWSGWLLILLWKYCPRDVLFFGSSKDAFKYWLRSEVEEAAHYNAWFVFNLSFQGNELLYDHSEPPAPQSYKVFSDYYGDLCVPEEDLIPAMQGSPFYKCFNGLPPFSDYFGSPPSSHFNYDSNDSGDSFDSITEHNIINSMEA
jgi:hypothetical protein